MKNIDVMAHLSAFGERTPVIVRVPAHICGDGKDTHCTIQSINEESAGEDGLVVVITLGTVVDHP